LLLVVNELPLWLTTLIVVAAVRNFQYRSFRWPSGRFWLEPLEPLEPPQ
jgi:hypothetical protein